MPFTFQITVTDAQKDAMDLHLGVGAEAYVASIVEAQAKESAKAIAREEIDRLVDANLPIPSTRPQIIASAKAYKESQTTPVVP
jgi:hypothetical protein